MLTLQSFSPAGDTVDEVSVLVCAEESSGRCRVPDEDLCNDNVGLQGCSREEGATKLELFDFLSDDVQELDPEFNLD